MKYLKVSLVVVCIAVAAWLTWNYLDGPLKVKRDMHAFAASLEQCETFSRDLKTIARGVTVNYAIDGIREDRCHVRMETLGPHVLNCAFAVEDLPVIAQGFHANADALDMFGGMTFKYSSSDPDPLTRALNSDACESVIN